jgi:hypothetical protein
MAAPQFSPGVLIREVDLTTTTNPTLDNVGVVVGPFSKGPVSYPTTITSERQLVEVFGKPNDQNYEYWYTAANFIQYGGVCRVIRIDSAQMTNASNLLGSGATATVTVETGSISSVTVTSGGTGYSNSIATVTGGGGSGAKLSVTIEEGEVSSIQVIDGGEGYVDGDPENPIIITIIGLGPKIKNLTDYENNILESANIFQWIARDPGELGNSIRIYITDAGADQILHLDQPSSTAEEPEFTEYSTVSSEADTTAKTYNYVVEFTLKATDLISAFSVGQTVKVVNGVNTTTGTVTGWDRSTRKLSVVGLSGKAIQVGNTIFVGTDVSSATAKGSISTIDRALYVVLNENSQLFQSSGATQSVFVTDNNTEIYSIADVDDAYQYSEIFPGLKWVTLSQRPETSPFASQRGGKNDLMHIAVFDSDGRITGNPNQLIEKYLFVSKAAGSRSVDGQNNYYVDVVNSSSNYIWFAEHETNSLWEFNPSVDGSWGKGASTKFDLIKQSNPSGATKITSLNYNFSGGFQDYEVDLTYVNQGYDLVSDPETEDVDFILMGPSMGNDTDAKASHIISIVNARKDCLAFISAIKEEVVNISDTEKVTRNIVTFFNKLASSSYTIFDSGYKYMYDKYNDTYRYMSCNSDIAGLCLETTLTNEPWYSPAGFARGNLKNIIRLAYNPRKAQRDSLYAARVNPIVTFPGQGTVLFGDKTAQGFSSAFDRINVRRLFLTLEKIIGEAAKTQLFELNDEATRSTFRNLVEPYLRDVQGKRGVQDFLVVCDERNNPPESIDRGEFYAEIYVKPTRTINYITLSFVATRTGVQFSEVVS